MYVDKDLMVVWKMSGHQPLGLVTLTWAQLIKTIYNTDVQIVYILNKRKLNVSLSWNRNSCIVKHRTLWKDKGLHTNKNDMPKMFVFHIIAF